MHRGEVLNPHKPQRKETSMKVLNKMLASFGPAIIALIDKDDHELMRQFFEVRTEIWSYKYKEPINAIGLETDLCDERAEVIVVITTVNGCSEVIGGCRIIRAKRGDTLPICSCANRVIECPALEVSRFFLTTIHCTEDDRRGLLLALIEGIESFASFEGFIRGYATIRASLHEVLTRLGIPMLRIGKNQEHGGRPFVPVMLFVRNPEQAMLRQQQCALHTTPVLAHAA